jgi:hypothetical protein
MKKKAKLSASGCGSKKNASMTASGADVAFIRCTRDYPLGVRQVNERNGDFSPSTSAGTTLREQYGQVRIDEERQEILRVDRFLENCYRT